MTWLHWWEANRELYLRDVLAKQEDREPVLRDADRTNNAAEAMIDLTRLDDQRQPTLRTLRAAATLSLGRIGTDTAMARLIELTGDEREAVRTAAWLGLGASGHDLARRALLDTELKVLSDRAARVVALGMLRPGDQEAIALLMREIVDLEPQPLKAVALRSLRLLKAPRIAEIGYEAIWGTTSVRLAAEAVMAMGEAPDAAHAELILSLLRGGKPAMDLPLDEDGLTRDTCFAAAYVLGRYEGLYEGKYRLRRALSEYTLRTPGYGGGDFYRGAAVLALADIAQPEDETVFIDALEGKTVAPAPDEDEIRSRRGVDGERTFTRRDDPVRGYAAIAMGMYLNRLHSEAAGEDTADVPGRYAHETQRATRRFLDRLSRTLASDHEPEDVRAAAAMGLAFSGLDEAPGLIAAGLKAAERDDVLVIGYGTLALAMLGDERAAIPALRYMKNLAEATRENNLTTGRPIYTVLGLRAMALTLGITGDERAVKAMAGSWGADPWVSIESAKALAMMGDDSLADTLIGVLHEDANRPETLLAVLGLGELLEAQRPSRLSWLTVDSLYPLWVDEDLGDEPGGTLSGDSSSRLSWCVPRIYRSFVNREPQAPANIYLYEIMLRQ